MCLYPRLIKNKKYTITQKNGGNVPIMNDKRIGYVAVGCGKCIECMKQKKNAWQVRMLEELKDNKNGVFVTMTFSNESILELLKDVKFNNTKKDIENETVTLGVRRFLERWRKLHKKSVRHWLVTELGHEGFERIHIHGIIWTDYSKDIERIWKYGHVWIGDYVNEKTINYIVKYINKIDEKHKGYVPKVLCSKGIGSGYMNRFNSNKNIYNGKETKEFYKTSNGEKMALPKYYRNKMYSDDQREKLWLNLLDKNEMFVCGERVDADDEIELNRIRDFYRNKNRRLGYGNNEKEWDRDEYLQNKNKLNMINKYTINRINENK